MVSCTFPLLTILALATAAPAAGGGLPRLLVFPVSAAGGASPVLADQLTETLLAHVGKQGRFQVKSTRDVQQVLQQEQAKQMLGCASLSCATDLAQLMDADQIITGTVTRLGDDHVVALSRLRAGDAVSLQRVNEVVRGKPARVLERVPEWAGQLLTDVKVPEVNVELRVLARRVGSEAEVPLQPGEKLRQGDQLAFEFTVEPAAHVYVIQRTKATGTIQVLFPNPDIQDVKNPLPAGTRVRIPGGGQSFEVDNQDLGLENVFVVASPRELPRLTEALARLEGGTSPTTREQAEGAMVALLGGGDGDCRTRATTLDGAESSPACRGRTRGLQLKNAAAGKPAVTARLRSAPGDDTLFYAFSFEHVAAP